MRRRLAVVVAALVAVFALGGCGQLPPGVDGDLTNNWPTMPPAEIVVPVVGDCYSRGIGSVSTGDDAKTSCENPHDTETAYVGTFTGADAQRAAAPGTGSQALATAFADCRKNTTAYLGDDFDLGLLSLIVVLPTIEDWEGGARWYRCDIIRYLDMNYVPSSIQGTVKDGLRADRPLALTCAIFTEDSTHRVIGEQSVACSTPHNAEVAGLYTAPDVPWRADKTARDTMATKGCDGVVAQYLGESGGRVINPILGWDSDGFNQQRWDLGDRTIRCYALGIKDGSVNGVRFIGSVKGIGTRAPT